MKFFRHLSLTSTIVRTLLCMVAGYANDILIRVDGAKAGEWLYYADCWHRFWHAAVNGNEVSTYKANLAYKAVRLEEGQHLVHFRFHSTRLSMFMTGLNWNGLIWVVMVLYLIGRESIYPENRCRPSNQQFEQRGSLRLANDEFNDCRGTQIHQLRLIRLTPAGDEILLPSGLRVYFLPTASILTDSRHRHCRTHTNPPDESPFRKLVWTQPPSIIRLFRGGRMPTGLRPALDYRKKIPHRFAVEHAKIGKGGQSHEPRAFSEPDHV